MEDSNNKLREENEKLRAESERKAISNERLLTSYVIPRMEERIRSLEGTVKRQAKELWEARAEIEALRKGLKHNETGNKEVFEVSHGGGDQGSSKDEKHCEQNEQNKQFEKKEFMREQKKFLELAKQEIKTYKENSEQSVQKWSFEPDSESSASENKKKMATGRRGSTIEVIAEVHREDKTTEGQSSTPHETRPRRKNAGIPPERYGA